MKNILVFAFLVLSNIFNAQENNPEKVILNFRYFKYPDAEFKLDL